MLSWTSRHRILTWSIAWGVTGMGLFTADVFSVPRRGPLWVGVLLGLVAWSVAGASTFYRGRIALGMVVWAVAYLVAFRLGAVWADWFGHNRVGSIASAGFVGALLGWATGGALGALVSSYISTSQRRSVRPIMFAAAWGLSFLVAGYVGLGAALYSAQAAKDALAFLGSQRVALTIGWGLGTALGGMIASMLGLAALRAIIGPSPEAAG
jgi:hypothetical protein